MADLGNRTTRLRRWARASRAGARRQPGGKVAKAADEDDLVDGALRSVRWMRHKPTLACLTFVYAVRASASRATRPISVLGTTSTARSFHASRAAR